MDRSFSLFIVLACMVTPALAAEPYQLSDQTTDVRLKEESLQWTPESVTVIDQEVIESTFRRTLSDLQGYVPGLVIDPISSTPQGAAIGLRGIHSNNASKGFEPAVALTIDGVYVGTHSAQNPVLFDFEQIEIARGPQGTFLGSPAEAGAIHLRRTRPTGELEVKTRLSIGSDEGSAFDAVVNFPIADGFAGKLSGYFIQKDDSQINNPTNGRAENTIDKSQFSVSLLWNQRDDLSVQYTYDVESDDSDTPALLNHSRSDDLNCTPNPATPNVTTNCASTTGRRVPESGSRNITLQNFSNDRSFEGDYHTLRIDAEFMDHTITSITGFRSTEENFSQDWDATSADTYSSIVDQDYDQFSTELRIAGATEDMNYVLGAYYLNTEYDLNRTDLYVLDLLNNIGRVLPALIPGENRVINSNQDAIYASLFGHIEYTWDDQWRLDAGLRLGSVDKDFKHRIAGNNATQPLLFPNTDILVDGDRDWEKTSGNAGFSYKVDDSAMVYGRYAVDHTPGGFNDNANSSDSAGPYTSSSTQTIEIGMKSDWLDDTLRLNMAFYNSYQDDKVELIANRVANGNIEASYANASEIKVRGFDLEFEYVPFDNLFFRGAWGHMSSDYDRFTVPDLTSPGDQVELQLEPHRAPSNSFYLSGEYVFPYWEGEFTFFADYQYMTDYRSNPRHVLGNVRSHTIWNVSLQYNWRQYQLRLFSQNLNDKRHIVNVDQQFDAEFTSLLSTFTSTQGIATVADVNQPRYTGIEFVWIPAL